MVIIRDRVIVDGSAVTDDRVTDLNFAWLIQAGQDGWELVSAFPDRGNYLLKRPHVPQTPRSR